MITAIELGHEVITYIKSRLSEGKTLSKHLLRLPLNKGHSATYLPQTTSPDAIRRFEVGGIVPSTEVQFGADVSKYKVVKLQRTEIDLKLANFISSYLNQPGTRYAVFEHALADPSDPWLSQTSAKYFTYKSEVYIFLNAQDTNVAAILTAMKAASTYRFTGILTTPTRMPDINTVQEVEQNILQSLAETTGHIIVGAYDGESEIIWSRPIDLKEHPHP